MSLLTWKLHGDGKSISQGDVVSTDERLTWPRTIGVGLQHIAAMFGATFLVPIITGFPPTTTLFFSGIGTLLFLALTQNKVPSYLGSSSLAISDPHLLSWRPLQLPRHMVECRQLSAAL